MKLFLLFSFAVLLFYVRGCPQCGGEDPAVVAQMESESSAPPKPQTQESTSDEQTQTDNKEEESSTENEEPTPPPVETSPQLEEYKRHFLLHRTKQLEAAKGIAQFENNEQRYQLVNMMLKQLFKVLAEAKQNLTLHGFLPGDPFPEDENVKEAFSKVLENTAMFGDLVLFMPEVVHSMYDKEKEWQVLLAWCYGFSTQSAVYSGQFKAILNMMAQEANIIPKDKFFINPYLALTKLQNDLTDKMKKKQEKEKKDAIKLKKKKERGPKLRKTEL
ncbi:coiled-coil domain-containing protein 134-like [Physella acuta]|uniref:coiled-coil domain-containing protein 134-like n=1 Tax=Physella acuta TaxID=109671 RepID=UPI0027DE05F6|nr:coiled-coil domain-containing protein 134-like [Physella acuta]